MRRLTLCVTLLVSTAFTGPAGAGPAEEPQEPSKPASPEKERAPAGLGHKYQFGLGVRAGTGFRVIMPYGDESCGDADAEVCGARLPVWLELSPSFGITQSLEVLLDVRLYLEQDFTDSRGYFFAPGLKYYTDPNSLFKFYASGQVVFENQEQLPGGPGSFDIAARATLGVQFDVLRYVGLYVQGGLIVGFLRWLTFTIDGSAGIQIRY